MNAYELAKAEIGTVEWNNGSNPKVLAYYRDAGFPGVTDDATAWCAAFVGAMIKRSGGKPTGSLMARSYLTWGNPVDLKDAREGDIAVFSRGNSTWQGHVAFLVKENASTISVLGGNQSDQVKVSTYPKASLLSIRRAAGTPQPAPKPVSPSIPAATPQPRPAGLFAALAGILAAIFPRKGA
jgi:uncharacterized protein (TIGR02594 family)